MLQKNLKSIETLFTDQIRNALIKEDFITTNKILNVISKEKIISGILLITKEKNIYFPIDKNYYSKERYTSYRFKIYDSPYFKTNYLADVEFFIEKSIHQNRVIQQLRRIAIYFVIFTFFFWILIVFYTNKYLTMPLKKLLDGIREFEEHDEEKSHIKLQLNNLRELTILADAFNKMSGKISEDIINLKQLTMIQNLQKKALKKANRAKDDFLANMSHELKTPLNSINLISSIMLKDKDKKLNNKEIKNLEIINNCGKDLLFLINDVLDISKLEAGKLELYYETINIKRLLYETKDMFEAQILEKNLHFIFEFDDSLEFIYSDRQRIKQIIKNLLSNSLKFVENGSISLLAKDENEFVKIIVKDDGIGIEEDKLSTIFDRFKQADESTTRKYGGTGLGLAICKDLIKLFKGDIKIESQLNIGTTVSITIPKNIEKINNDAINREKGTIKIKKQIKEINETKGILFEENEKEIEIKQNIAILHKDPISFMELIINLNKKYKVAQYLELKEFLLKIKKQTYDLYILDSEHISKEQIYSNFDLEKENLILVTKDDIRINEKIEIIKKPFDKNQIAEIISKKLST